MYAIYTGIWIPIDKVDQMRKSVNLGDSSHQLSISPRSSTIYSIYHYTRSLESDNLYKK